jgi:hypothetical protein
MQREMKSYISPEDRILEKVYSITLIYGLDLSFNPQPQNQVLDTCKLTKPFSLHPSAVFRWFSHTWHHVSYPCCQWDPLVIHSLSSLSPSSLLLSFLDGARTRPMPAASSSLAVTPLRTSPFRADKAVCPYGAARVQELHPLLSGH